MTGRHPRTGRGRHRPCRSRRRTAARRRDRPRPELLGAGYDSLAAARRGAPVTASALLVLVGWHVDELPDELIQAALDPAEPLLVLAAANSGRAGQQWRLAGDTLTGTGADPVTVPTRPAVADQVVALVEHARNDPAVCRATRCAPRGARTPPPPT